MAAPLRSHEVFVGRGREARWLAAALVRSPLVVVWGPGGIGKSTIVRQVLAQAAVVWVTFRGVDRDEPALLDVARALRTRDSGPVDWESLLQSPEALRDFVLDLAVRRGDAVVLDDAHHLSAEQSSDLMTALAAHSTAARFVVTTRTPPPGPLTAAIEIAPLGRRDVAALVRSIAGAVPKAAERAIVERAAGSPWRLRQLIAGEEPPDVGAIAEPLDAAALARLAWLDVPVPADFLEVLAIGPAQLAAFARSALVETAGDRVRLHELARETVEPTPPSPEDQRRVATALLARPELDLALRGVGIALDLGDVSRVADALDARGGELVTCGFAVKLWSVLAERSIPELERWRHRAALAMGDTRVLAALSEPRAPDVALAELWTCVLAARGASAEARDYAARALARFEGAPPESLARLRIEHGRATANAGDFPAAIRALEAFTPADPELRARRGGLLSSCLSIDGRDEDAAAVANTVRGDVLALGWPMRADVGYNLALAIYLTGRLHEAATLIDAIAGEHGSARLDLGRRMRFLRARIDLELGAFARADAELARLEPWVRGGSLLRPYLTLMQGHVALATGNVPAARNALDRLGALGRVASIEDERALFALALGVLSREPPPERCPGSGTSIFARLAVTTHAEALVRAGRLTPDAAMEAPLGGGNPELLIAWRTTRAVARALTDEPALALDDIDAALRVAHDTRFGLREAALLALRGDVLVILGRFDSAATLARDLAELARKQGSGRVAHASRFLAAVARPSLDDPGALEALSAGGDVAPDVAARARRLLGGEAKVDLLDEKVLAAVTRRAGWRAPSLLGASGDGAWGIDVPRRRAWLPDGSYVNLAPHPTAWRFLEVCVAHGGRASKEELLVEAWGEREYHPLHHDNRLHTLVRNLRRRLDGDAAQAARIVTTGDGYALGGSVRVLAPDAS